jgi:peptide deformylase
MIIKDPDTRLHTECTPVIGNRIKTISAQLLKEVGLAYEAEKANHNIVVGLAAPQIGKNLQAFTAFGGVFINPVIVEHSKKTIESREGCLSLPSENIYIKQRYDSVTLLWSNPARQVQRRIFTGDAAIVVQHEADHLNGIMCNE